MDASESVSLIVWRSDEELSSFLRAWADCIVKVTLGVMVQWLLLCPFTAGTQVQPLVKELRACKLCSTAKNKQIKI